MAINPTTGAKFFIGPANDAADDIAAMELLTFEEVGEIESIDNISETANQITFTSLSDARQRIGKGTAQAAAPSVTMAVDFADAGQLALIAAANPTNTQQYAFKIELNDQPSGGTQPTTIYGRGYVMEYAIQGITPDNFVMAQSSLGTTIGLIYDYAA